MYDEKDNSYFASIRNDIISLIPESYKNCSVLEIGCGNGATLYELKKRGVAGRCVGIELFPIKDNFYSELDTIINGDVESMLLPPERFDLIILGDVLEHLIDPWSVLSKLKNSLSPKGLVLASIPNIRNYKVLIDLVFNGDFRYVQSGILDKTHLRFFCKKNIIEMFEDAGYKIDGVSSLLDTEVNGKRYWLNKLCFGRLYDFLYPST